MSRIFFNNWQDIIRTIVVGILAYAVLILFLRISGKRTLAKMNAFDLVVTVALGSTLATILLNKSVALAEGATAFAMLIALQFVVTFTSVRLKWVRKVVTGEPQMLLYRGEMLRDAMRRERVAETEILAAIRGSGAHDVQHVEAVILETDGSFSVVQSREGDAGSSSLTTVLGPHREQSTSLS